MFSVVAGVLLTPPPVHDPDRVYLVWGYYPQADLGFAEQPLHGRHFATMREETRAFSAVAAFRSRAYNLGEGAVPERLDGAQVSAEFFRAIGVDPRLGRFFVRPDEVPGSRPCRGAGRPPVAPALRVGPRRGGPHHPAQRRPVRRDRGRPGRLRISTGRRAPGRVPVPRRDRAVGAGGAAAARAIRPRGRGAAQTGRLSRGCHRGHDPDHRDRRDPDSGRQGMVRLPDGSVAAAAHRRHRAAAGHAARRRGSGARAWPA